MKNNDKYIEILQNTYKGNSPMVNTAVYALQMGLIASMGQRKTFGVGKEIWQALGSPPAQYVNNDVIEGYMIDLGDTKTLGAILAVVSHNLIQAGCFAATDISDAINAINNDNMDNKLTDREAMVAVSRVMVTGMNAFHDLRERAEKSISRR